MEPGETFNWGKALASIEVFVTLPTGQKLAQAGKVAGGAYEFDPQTQAMEVLVVIPNPNLLIGCHSRCEVQTQIEVREFALPRHLEVR